MERLISSSQPHHHLRLKPTPFLPARLNSLPTFTSSSPRLNSLTCKLQPPFLNLNQTSFKKSTFSHAFLEKGSPTKPHFAQPNLQTLNFPGLVIAFRNVTLLAILVTLIHPLICSPAFASSGTVAKISDHAVAATGNGLLRNELLSSAWTGFFAGCLHTLSGPDHLAALAPLSIGRTPLESAAVGALWGCGHDAGQLIFGLLFLLLKDRLHIEIIRTWGTRVVGVTLLVIGAMGIRETSEIPSLAVALENSESEVGALETIQNPSTGKKKKKIGFATFATGIVHGLQPDALMMILPALALPSRLAGASFLIMFLVGTVAAMGSYTVLIGSCSQALKEKIPRITEKLTWASSLIAIGLGLAILVSQFFGFSLY